MIRRSLSALAAVGLALAGSSALAWSTVQEGNSIYVTNGNPRNPGTTVIKVGSSSDKGDVRTAEKLAHDLNKAADKGGRK